MEFTLQELYDFANVCPPGGNHYTIKESERVWSSEKGKCLLALGSEFLVQYFILKKIYGNMAQRYSGVIDTIETRIFDPIYEFLTTCKFPHGYRFFTEKNKEGLKIIIQKDDETLSNLEARIGTEYYRDIPDKVHRPPYYTKSKLVRDYLTVSKIDFERIMKNKERSIQSIDQLRHFQIAIEKKNCLRFLQKIQIYTREQLIEIIETINIENDEYQEEDYIDLSRENLLHIIEYEFSYVSYNFIRKIILSF